MLTAKSCRSAGARFRRRTWKGGRLDLSKRASREGDFIFVGRRTGAQQYPMALRHLLRRRGLGLLVNALFATESTIRHLALAKFYTKSMGVGWAPKVHFIKPSRAWGGRWKRKRATPSASQRAIDEGVAS